MVTLTEEALHLQTGDPGWDTLKRDPHLPPSLPRGRGEGAALQAALAAPPLNAMFPALLGAPRYPAWPRGALPAAGGAGRSQLWARGRPPTLPRRHPGRAAGRLSWGRARVANSLPSLLQDKRTGPCRAVCKVGAGRTRRHGGAEARAARTGGRGGGRARVPGDQATATVPFTRPQPPTAPRAAGTGSPPAPPQPRGPLRRGRGCPHARRLATPPGDDTCFAARPGPEAASASAAEPLPEKSCWI